jgi:hypothetical protein
MRDCLDFATQILSPAQGSPVTIKATVTGLKGLNQLAPVERSPVLSPMPRARRTLRGTVKIEPIQNESV